jgi:hypothetical protein
MLKEVVKVKTINSSKGLSNLLLVTSRNWLLNRIVKLLLVLGALYIIIIIVISFKKIKKQYYKILDIRMRCAILTSLIL